MVRGDDYETSLWDLKQIADSVPECNFLLWDIPMGFETGSDCFNLFFCTIMRHPYGIWNIFGKTPRISGLLIMRHPYGIWNFGCAEKKGGIRYYETSLWDLKPLIVDECHLYGYIMRHPYGIWNVGNLSPIIIENHYETSLWDLKLTNIPSLKIIKLIMRHPYGIWNSTRSGVNRV